MKVIIKRFIFIKILIVLFGIVKNEQVNLTVNSQNKEEIKKMMVINKSDQGYVIPQTVKHLEDTVLEKSMLLPIHQTIQSTPILSSPMMHHQITTTTYMPQPVRPAPCPCAAEVRCKPCNGIVEPPMDMYNTPVMTCPCAAPISCPKCPPISLIHEIAAKKAQQDQQLAYNLKSQSEKISKYFDMIIKYSNDVVDSENDAVKAAKQMEEATLKALFARKNMISEKARLIAKTSIVENRPCAGINCPILSPQNLAFYGDKIFPVEVENIKEYMDDTYTTNLNGFNSGGDYNTLDSIENEAEGQINIHKIRYNNNGMRRLKGFQQNKIRGCKFIYKYIGNTSVDFPNSNNLMGMNNQNMNNNPNPFFNQPQNLNGQQSGAAPNNFNQNMQNMPNMNQMDQVPNNTMPNQMNQGGNSLFMNPQQGPKPNLR